MMSRTMRKEFLAILVGIILLGGVVTAAISEQAKGNGSVKGNSNVAGCEPTAEALRAKELYLKNCARCHGDDGRAQTPLGQRLKAGNLADARWQWETSDKRIAEIITNGEERMPAFGKKLSPEEVELVVTHVRTLRERNHPSSPSHQ